MKWSTEKVHQVFSDKFFTLIGVYGDGYRYYADFEWRSEFDKLTCHVEVPMYVMSIAVNGKYRLKELKHATLTIIESGFIVFEEELQSLESIIDQSADSTPSL